MSVTKRRWWLPGWLRRKKRAPEAIDPLEIDSTGDVAVDASDAPPTPAFVDTPIAPAVEGSIGTPDEAPVAAAAASSAAPVGEFPTAIAEVTGTGSGTGTRSDSGSGSGSGSGTITDTGAAVTDFTVADDSVVATQDLLDDLDEARPVIARLTAEVLATEGPIPTLRLVSTVARKLGYDRIGDTRRQDLSAIVTASQTVADGFVWPTGTGPESWRSVRRTVNRDDRSIAEISPTEIANAIVLVLAGAPAGGIERETALRGAADLLGYGRIGESARRWIDLAIAAAIAQGRMSETDGALSLS